MASVDARCQQYCADKQRAHKRPRAVQGVRPRSDANGPRRARDAWLRTLQPGPPRALGNDPPPRARASVCPLRRQCQRGFLPQTFPQRPQGTPSRAGSVRVRSSVPTARVRRATGNIQRERALRAPRECLIFFPGIASTTTTSLHSVLPSPRLSRPDIRGRRISPGCDETSRDVQALRRRTSPFATRDRKLLRSAHDVPGMLMGNSRGDGDPDHGCV